MDEKLKLIHTIVGVIVLESLGWALLYFDLLLFSAIFLSAALSLILFYPWLPDLAELSKADILEAHAYILTGIGVIAVAGAFVAIAFMDITEYQKQVLKGALLLTIFAWVVLALLRYYDYKKVQKS